MSRSNTEMILEASPLVFSAMSARSEAIKRSREATRPGNAALIPGLALGFLALNPVVWCCLATKEDGVNVRHLVIGFCLAGVVSSLLLLCPQTRNESALMFIIFDFLFVATIFPLSGVMSRKFCLLILGNIIGLFWNYLLSLLAQFLVEVFGGFFGSMHIVLSPFLNLIWIVSFSSLSLAFLRSSEKKRAEVEA